MNSKKVKLPSGAELTITAAPFADARALYQAVCEELKGLKFDPKAEVDVNFRKDIFCAALASKKVEEALWVCMSRALYDKKKIDLETFEPVGARQDYLLTCYEVGKENILPFMKSLYAQFGDIVDVLKKPQA